MRVPQSNLALFDHLDLRLTQQLIREQTAAHAYLTVDPPNREGDPLRVECLLPRQHMLVDAVDQRAVKVKNECGS